MGYSCINTRVNGFSFISKTKSRPKPGFRRDNSETAWDTLAVIQKKLSHSITLHNENALQSHIRHLVYFSQNDARLNSVELLISFGKAFSCILDFIF